MVKYENMCCDCAVPAYPCVGESCPFLHVPVYYCDICGSEDSVYEIDEQHYCKQCAKEYLIEIFTDLSVSEMGEALDVPITQITDRWW